MQRTLNLQASEFSPIDTASLDAPFKEDEVKHAIMQFQSDKAPGPDGRWVLCKKKKKEKNQHYWTTIKDDIMRALRQFQQANSQGLHLPKLCNSYTGPQI